MNIRAYSSAAERRSALEQELSTDLSVVEQAQIDEESTVHCENVIGAISIPLGVAGPLALKGDHVNGEHYLPLATTEGALVASVSRGAKTITANGGATVATYDVGVSRGPVFATGSIAQSKKLHSYIKQNEQELAEVAASTSSHLKLKKIMVKSIGPYVFVRFQYLTEEAMGMNMVTIATQKVINHLEEKTGIASLAVAGNFDVDKKPSWLNTINCRGKEAWAESIISKESVQDILKTTPQAIFDVWLGKCMLGSALSGSMGFNCHAANVVAAFYLATGQDAAHVVEGSQAITTARVLENGDLYVAVYLPALLVGTVGGGTKLKTQTAARKLLNVNSALGLAEVVAGAVLAGELSLLASLSIHTLAPSHEKLGRDTSL